MAHVDAAPVRAAQGLPGGAQDDRDMGDRERSGAIVEGGLVTKKWIRDPITPRRRTGVNCGERP
jgi:hypothetical protein